MDEVAQIRAKIDIVALISEYIPLKKMGRNFKTTCPFHSEKTPSFVVSPERQIWHCFGCNRGGDCFSFLMEYENLEFPEALRILAQKTGITLVDRQFDKGLSSQKEQMYMLNRQAMEFYHYVLTSHHAGAKALSYLREKRGIKDKVIKTFMIGFAPGVGNALTRYLINKKKNSQEDIVASGLGVQKPGGVFDFFTARLMFPLIDHRGNIMGFSGRVLNDTFEGSKYVNTRDTIVYHKGSVFFGLNIAKEEIKKENRAIIMEGEFDVISSFQEGIGNAVAVKGTALSENQVNLISRFCQKVSLCFDEDSAGQEAIKRSLPILEKKGLTTTVVVMDGKDPDEAIRSNAIAFKKAVKNDVSVYDFLLEKALSRFDKKLAEGKKQISDELLPFFGNIDNEIVKEHYLKKLAGELDTSYDAVVRQVERLEKKQLDSSLTIKTTQKRERLEILEEYLLALIIQHQNLKTILPLMKKFLPFMTEQAYGKILQNLIMYLENIPDQALSMVNHHAKFLSILPQELLSMFDRCYLLPLPVFENNEKYEKEIENMGRELQTLTLKHNIKTVGEAIKDKEKISDSQEVTRLQTEFSRLTSRLSRSQK